MSFLTLKSKEFVSSFGYSLTVCGLYTIFASELGSRVYYLPFILRSQSGARWSGRMKRKIKTLSKAKKECWEAFSRYIRTRDCLKTTGTLDMGICICCPGSEPILFKKLQAGHFIPGRHNGNLFSEKYVNAQSWKCNAPAFLGGKNGNALAYRRAMIKMYGEGAEREAEEEAARVIQYKVFELEAMKMEYEKKTEELIAKHKALLAEMDNHKF